jgi:uncharacterized membrane protein YdbT with pleckstrin-like domain
MQELYSSHPVMFKAQPLYFIINIVLIPVFGLGLLLFLIWYLKVISKKLTITERDVLFESGLLSKDRREVSISSIRAVNVKQSLFNRIFGTGTVSIFSAGDQPEFEISGIPDPHTVRDLIKNRD